MSERSQQQCRLNHLQTALWFLLWTWVTTPIVMIVFFIQCPHLPMGYLFICVFVSSFFLAKSATSRIGAAKVILIPLFFTVLLFSGERILVTVGIQGLFIAPIWLSEILRFRAMQIGATGSSVLFLLQHIWSLWVVYLSHNSLNLPDGPMILWYFSFVPCFLVMNAELTEDQGEFVKTHSEVTNLIE